MNMPNIKEAKETDEQKQSRLHESRKRSQLARQRETNQQYQACLDDLSLRAQERYVK